MRVVLGLAAIACWLVAMGGCALAKSAVGEIQSLIVFLIGTVFFGAAILLEAINENSRKDREALAKLVDALGPPTLSERPGRPKI